MSAREYYSILGVREGASIAEIKQAFRLRAKLLHPDVNSGPRSVEQFVRLTEAYKVLSDLTSGDVRRRATPSVIVPNSRSASFNVHPNVQGGPGIWIFASAALFVVVAGVFLMDWMSTLGEDDQHVEALVQDKILPVASTVPIGGVSPNFRKISVPPNFVFSGPVSSIYLLPFKIAVSDPVKSFLLDRLAVPSEPAGLQSEQPTFQAGKLPKQTPAEKKLSDQFVASAVSSRSPRKPHDNREETSKRFARPNPVRAIVPKQKTAKMSPAGRHATSRTIETGAPAQNEGPLGASFNFIQTLVGGN